MAFGRSPGGGDLHRLPVLQPGGRLHVGDDRRDGATDELEVHQHRLGLASVRGPTASTHPAGSVAQSYARGTLGSGDPRVMWIVRATATVCSGIATTPSPGGPSVASTTPRSHDPSALSSVTSPAHCTTLAPGRALRPSMRTSTSSPSRSPVRRLDRHRDAVDAAQRALRRECLGRGGPRPGHEVIGFVAPAEDHANADGGRDDGSGLEPTTSPPTCRGAFAQHARRRSRPRWAACRLRRRMSRSLMVRLRLVRAGGRASCRRRGRRGGAGGLGGASPPRCPTRPPGPRRPAGPEGRRGSRGRSHCVGVP